MINGYVEGFLDCAEIFELKDFYNLNYHKNETDVIKIIKAHNQRPLREGNVKRASKSKSCTKKPNIKPSPQKGK